MTAAAPAIAVLLRGHSLSSPEGSLGYGGVYLVESGLDGAIHRTLFDCAHAGRRRALLAALEARGLGPADIDAVVLSHSHYDHVQNADLFSAARILVHPEELRELRDPDPADVVHPPWTAGILRGADVREAADGDVVAPGLRIVGLPGHTPGSIGLAVETPEGMAVLTGDAVSSVMALRAGQASSVRDAEAGAASVRRVLQTADVVYPGHDRPFRIVRTGPAPAAFDVEYLYPPDPLVFSTGNPESVPLESAYDPD